MRKELTVQKAVEVTIDADNLDWDYRGYSCRIRKVAEMGHLCGYVQVPKGHPLYEMGYGDEPIDNLDVHGGITYSRMEDDRWWIGFDCAHAGDIVPAHPMLAIEGATYKDQEYVRAEISRLVQQLKELE